VSASNGVSRTVNPAGWYPGGTGKLGRLKCVAPPTQTSRLLTSARCAISSSATLITDFRQPATAAASAAVRPSSTPRFKLNAA
jgi:hypothetical protein